VQKENQCKIDVLFIMNVVLILSMFSVSCRSEAKNVLEFIKFLVLSLGKNENSEFSSNLHHSFLKKYWNYKYLLCINIVEDL